MSTDNWKNNQIVGRMLIACAGAKRSAFPTKQSVAEIKTTLTRADILIAA